MFPFKPDSALENLQHVEVGYGGDISDVKMKHVLARCEHPRAGSTSTLNYCKNLKSVILWMYED
jgi:hypothetical protein